MFKIARQASFVLLIVLLLSATLLLALTQDVKATTGLDIVYVNATTGDDTYDGSSPTHGSGNIGPKATISGGKGVANPGGTVHVAAGFYDEDIWIGQDLTLNGAGALTTVISHSLGINEPVVEVSTGGEPITPIVTISGFTIQNGNNHILEERRGGGIFINESCTAYLNNCAIVYNEADKGGGIYNTGTLYLNDSTIGENDALQGGGIYNEGMLYVDRCCVSSNTAQYRGGGILNSDGQVWLTNCTISGNSIWEFDISGGGGIYNDSGTITVLNCTIAFNSTSNYPSAVGGGFYDYSSQTMIFKNTIVANNTAGYDLYNNGSFTPGGVISLGNNIDSEDSCGFSQPSDQRNTDPLLVPLQNNGGPTSTHAITASSPAFNMGTNVGAPATDQRGVTRPQGTNCDIGAYELEVQQQPAQIKVQASSSPQVSEHPLPTPPRILVTNVNSQPRSSLPNQPVVIYANVVNRGDSKGSYNIYLKINGQVEETRTGSIGGHTAKPLKFEVLREEPGTYFVDINGGRAYFTIIEQKGHKSMPAVDPSLFAYIFAAVLILATLISGILVHRRINRSHYD